MEMELFIALYEFEQLQVEAYQKFGGRWMPEVCELLKYVRTEYIGWWHPPMQPWYAEGLRATVCTLSYYFRMEFRSDGAMEAKNLLFNNRVAFFATGHLVTPEAFMQAVKLCEKLARAEVRAIDQEINGLNATQFAALKEKQMTSTTKKMLAIRRKYHPVSLTNMNQYFLEMVGVINSRI